MSLTEESYEGEGGAERRAQRALTDSVGVRLVRPSKSRNLKGRTWTWRFGFRRGARAEM
jgi:hypothetical protein